MTRPLRSLLATLLVGTLVAWSAAGLAQTPAAAAPAPSETQEQLTARVDALAGKLAGVEKELDKVDVNEGELDKIAADVAPLALDAQALVERLVPRVAAFKARVDQLGPKPADKAAAETEDVAKERVTLQATYDAADGLLKRAKLLEVNAQQDTAYVAKRQRALFTVSLFQRSASLLSPQLWRKVAADTPDNVSEATRVFNDWIVDFNAGLTGGKLVTFWVLVLGMVVLYWPLSRLGRRLLHRDTALAAPDVKPDTWHKIIAACWTSASVAGAMIAVMYGIVYVFSFFTVPDGRVLPLFYAMQAGVVRIALAAGFSRGILAPGKSRWRLVNLDDTTCDKLVRIIVGVAIIVSGAKLIEALNTVIYASIDFSVAARGVGALLVAIALALAMVDLGRDPEAENPDREEATDASTTRGAWYGLIRAGTWGLVIVIVVAVLAGYSPFASFLVDQIVLVAGTLAVLFLLIRLIDKACELSLRPSSPVGRNLIYTVGLRRETLGQMSILLAGVARVALIGLALLVVAAPWGMQSTDISGNLRAIFFGFKIGDVTISVEGIVIAIVSFVVVLAATRAVQSWLEDRYLPQTRLDAGLRNSIKTSLGYVGVILALSLAAANLGVDFQKLAIVAGALSVGIGFGLQSIVNNFVSGLILLWERAVRVGDWVVVGSDQGYVRKINVRSTEIETFDRASVIVPNSNLVSGVVKNLMRADKVGRLSIEVTVHSSADPEAVRETLIDIARDNDAVASFPVPQVRFTDLKAGAMTFELFCFVSDVEGMARTKSDLYFELYKRFTAAGFFNGPAPAPTGIDIIGLDRLEKLIETSRAPAEPAARSRKAG